MENILKELKFDDKGLIPAVVQDRTTKEVLMVAYMNKEAFAYTLKTRRAYYYSTENDKVYKFGAEKGNTQRVMSIDVDCNGDALMLCVQQKGHVCHHNGSHRTCFNNTIYKRNAAEYSKRRKFGRVEIDKDFDFSKEDYSEELE